jgi:hypothetical protein
MIQILKDRTVVDPDPYPELGHNAQRYKYRDLTKRCYCDDCRLPAMALSSDYRRRVKTEVLAGRRKAPNWMKAAARRDRIKMEIEQAQRERVRQANLHRAAVAATRILKAFEDQLDHDREYLPAHGPRRAQLLVRIYVDEQGAGKWRERGAS